MEALVGAPSGFREPSVRRGFRVEARRIRLDLQELDEVLAVLNANRAGCLIRFPQSVVEVDFLPQSRVSLDQIATHAVNEVASLALSKRRQMSGCEIKWHTDAP
ncbi:hypothetical protein L2Y90_18330 [Burkholderia pyrrocinia]|uniref:hypothetical protein n=1 Tax=Burkholderia pyrrocinia TaxID=60550 RepID=UPI00215A93D2|nr:hypothetical protein [Burkholderia pyrrocinia]UVE68730.1 hypothetical protein L2Y90_18330 [Burkholderia pyrrocinia]